LENKIISDPKDEADMIMNRKIRTQIRKLERKYRKQLKKTTSAKAAVK
jgi:hypothetical protein